MNAYGNVAVMLLVWLFMAMNVLYASLYRFFLPLDPSLSWLALARQVGKSSACLGLLGSLLGLGYYSPQDLAYIKPATMCEQQTPVVSWCETHGISCQGIGYVAAEPSPLKPPQLMLLLHPPIFTIALLLFSILTSPFQSYSVLFWLHTSIPFWQGNNESTFGPFP